MGSLSAPGDCDGEDDDDGCGVAFVLVFVVLGFGFAIFAFAAGGLDVLGGVLCIVRGVRLSSVCRC